MKTSLSTEPNGIVLHVHLRAETVFSDALFLVWFTLLVQRITSKTNVVLEEIVVAAAAAAAAAATLAAAAAAAAAALSAITQPVIKFQNYVEFIY